jgi:hypothetical protein
MTGLMTIMQPNQLPKKNSTQSQPPTPSASVPFQRAGIKPLNPRFGDWPGHLDILNLVQDDVVCSS